MADIDSLALAFRRDVRPGRWLIPLAYGVLVATFVIGAYRRETSLVEAFFLVALLIGWAQFATG